MASVIDFAAAAQRVREHRSEGVRYPCPKATPPYVIFTSEQVRAALWLERQDAAHEARRRQKALVVATIDPAKT